MNKREIELELIQKVVEKDTLAEEIFYSKYDRLVWDICSKWVKAITTLSKESVTLEDMHQEVWSHIFLKAYTYNPKRSGVSSWIFIVAESKLGMMKRALEANKNNVLRNEMKYSMDSSIITSDSTDEVCLSNLIGDDIVIEDIVSLQEFLLDFIYVILEIIDSCTDKERKIYLLKMQGKRQDEISAEAGVSKSYIPKVYKRLAKKFKVLYNSLNEQMYINKEERDSLVKDLLGNKSNEYISDKYDLELETVLICKEMLLIIGIQD